MAHLTSRRRYVPQVPAASLAATHARLRAAYEQLGELYAVSDRYTKACRHYHQGVELFRSTSDPRSAAIMSIAFGRTLRSRLDVAGPPDHAGLTGVPASAGGGGAASSELLPAAARRLAAAQGGSVPAPSEMSAAELQDFERCVAAFEQAQGLASTARDAQASCA